MRMNCQWIGNKTKTGSSRLKTLRTAEAVERVTNGGMRKFMHASAIRLVFLPIATSFALRCRSLHISTLAYQFYRAQLPVFFQ